jgi:nucleotide-binding universal stress UspA family protein
MLATELEAGSELDGFRIESRLHSGGMAVIYRVTRDDLPGPAVMKVPRLGQGESGATIVSFEVEQMILEALGGGPVPKLFAVGDLARNPYLVMEHIEGATLSAASERAPLPVDEICRLIAATALAVQALHQRDVIHLDLKPSNIMLRPDGRAVLIDLGLAHHAHLPDLLAEEFRRPLGSAPYMSPEQVLGVRDDARSDTFALGVMLYQFATGELPFGSPTSPAGLRKRLTRRPVPPRALMPELPPALQEVIYRCLEVGADMRYSNAGQIAFDLQHLDKVELSRRAQWRHRPGLAHRIRDWVKGFGYEPRVALAPAARSDSAQIIMVAVAIAHTNEVQQQAIRNVVARFAGAVPDARIACVTVGRAQSALGTSDEATSAPRVHLKQLLQLRAWAAPIALPAQRVSFHVLEGGDPADALLDYASANAVDHIVMGAAPANLIGRNLMPAVADRVVAEAPCSVTVVRARG